VKAAATSAAESVYVLRLQNEDIGTFYKWDLIEMKMSKPTFKRVQQALTKTSDERKTENRRGETVELHTCGSTIRAHSNTLCDERTFGMMGCRDGVTNHQANDEQNPVRVLIAQDDAATRMQLLRLLPKLGYEVLVAQDGADAWRLLQGEDSPSLAILDSLMAGLDGVQVCRNVRASPRSGVYILILTESGQQQDLIAGMEAGADDYLTKPFDADELRVRLKAGERILELRQELRARATYDPLTGILNRRAILEILRRELAHVARNEMSVAVILADLDRFKQINDTHGHPVGDAVLCEAARRMAAPLRRHDVLGRYGGEEFLIVLRGCDTANALSIAERLRCSVATGDVNTSAGAVAITVSLGVAIAEPGQAPDLDALMLAADEALYRAKDGGRNRAEGPPRRVDVSGSTSH
jgi:two-component system cell cycle response regulator